MRFQHFQCAPSIEHLVASLAGRPGRFVLEDVAAGTAVIGAQPFLTVCANGEQTGPTDPLAILAEHLARFRDDGAPDNIPFAGGAVGCFSYDLGRTIEAMPSIAEEDVPTPDLWLGFHDSALCIDIPNRKCTAVSWSGDREAIKDWISLALSVPEGGPPSYGGPVYCPGDPTEVTSNFTKPGYLSAINRIKEYIAAGDVYQVNLAQRFDAGEGYDAWELYRALRHINPAPKSCYIEMGPITLAGASPEIFLIYEPGTRRIVTKPIKGTRPRGTDAAGDARLAQELLESEKDRAENLMIVDMLRNDLGRVARYGSVHVPKLWDIEKHPNVFQMVSTVEAELADDYGPVDLLRACFPGGSITGAPKIRAMEIIEELEPHRRGFYTGSAGFIDFRGRMDLNIVIRSFVVHESRPYFHAGGGIVIDSDPESEYQETMDKICGLRAALRECKERQ